MLISVYLSTGRSKFCLIIRCEAVQEGDCFTLFYNSCSIDKSTEDWLLHEIFDLQKYPLLSANDLVAMP